MVRLRKPHPCGGYEWEVTRLGADIGLRCLSCGRRLLLERATLEKRIVLKPGDTTRAPAKAQQRDA